MKVIVAIRSRFVRTVVFLGLGIFIVACGAPQNNTDTKQKIHKVLFIIVDGIPADVIERVNTPWIDSIAAQGGYARAYMGGKAGGYSQSPTISAVGYNTLLTGTWANKHNVWDNDIAAPNYHYPTVFRYLKNSYPEDKIGIYSTWLDNRTKLAGAGKPETDSINIDYYADGYELDTVAFPHDKEHQYIHLIDERVTEEADRSIRKQAPDLSWVYLEYTDGVAHALGDGAPMDEAVKIADKQIGRLWKAVQYRQQNFNEEWQIYVTTDHGRDEQGFGHGGQSERERQIWIATTAKDLNAHFLKGVPAMVDITPSMLRFLQVNIPKEEAFEMDGIPLSGPVSHTFSDATLHGNQLSLAWKALKKGATLKIWLSTTNHYKDGGKDEYQLIAEVPVAVEKATVDISKYPGDFYKVVLESKYNTVNSWVTR